ncbi:MAG: hypothetical protein ACLPQ4_01455 [Thermoplasmata archaeon]
MVGLGDGGGRSAGFHEGEKLRAPAAERLGKGTIGDACGTGLVNCATPGVRAGARQVTGPLARTVLAHGHFLRAWSEMTFSAGYADR